MNIVLKNKKEKLFIILLENNKKYNSCEKRDNDNHSQKQIEIDNHSLTLKLKNIYLKSSKNKSIRFSVPSVFDTSDLTPGSRIELSFSAESAIVLPSGPLALD